jgi:hypothetical protein
LDRENEEFFDVASAQHDPMTSGEMAVTWFAPLLILDFSPFRLRVQ